jgi:hypothetical protein
VLDAILTLSLAVVLGLVAIIDILYSFFHKVPVLVRGLLEVEGLVRNTFKRSTRLEGLLVTFSLHPKRLAERSHLIVEILSNRRTDYYCELKLDCDEDLLVERPTGPTVPALEPSSNTFIDSLGWMKTGEMIRRSYLIRPSGRTEMRAEKRVVKLSMRDRSHREISEISLGHLELRVS